MELPLKFTGTNIKNGPQKDRTYIVKLHQIDMLTGELGASISASASGIWFERYASWEKLMDDWSKIDG